MNIQELKNTTKSKIDDLFNDIERLKSKGDQVENQIKDEWNSALEDLGNSRDSLKNLYTKISEANKESVDELAEAFRDQAATAEKKLDRIQENYSKRLN